MSVRPASANAWRVSPPPYAQSPLVSSTAQPVFASACSTSSSAPAASGAFPASTSTAVLSSPKDQRLVGVDRHRRLVPVESLAGTLPPVSQLRIVDRHQPILRYPLLQRRPGLLPLHILDQHPTQQP